MVEYTGNLVPLMTSNTTPKGVVSNSGSVLVGYDAYKAFDRMDDAFGWIVPVGTQYLAYQFESPVAISKYTLKPRLFAGSADASGINQAPKNWTFEGSFNGSNWIVLDTRNNIAGWAYGVAKEFEFSNNVSYLHYRMNITANSGSRTYICIGEMQMMSIISYKLLIRNAGQYYYHDALSWVSLGTNPTSTQIETYGMTMVTAIQISEFEGLYGLDWRACSWTANTPATTATLKATPHPQILTAKNSIQLTGVESAIFKWTATGGSRISLSVDDGVTYHAFKNGIWIDVTNDTSNAMTTTEYSSLTWEQYSLLKGESNFLKHQYYIPDNSTVDDILITSELMGSNKIADSSSYQLSYDQSTKTIRYVISKTGSYFANYIDIV